MAEETTDKWIIQSFKMDREQYGENKGKWAGQIHLTNKERGTVYMNLGPSVCKDIFTIIRPDLLSTLHDISEDSMDKLRKYLE